MANSASFPASPSESSTLSSSIPGSSSERPPVAIVPPRWSTPSADSWYTMMVDDHDSRHSAHRYEWQAALDELYESESDISEASPLCAYCNASFYHYVYPFSDRACTIYRTYRRFDLPYAGPPRNISDQLWSKASRLLNSDINPIIALLESKADVNTSHGNCRLYPIIALLYRLCCELVIGGRSVLEEAFFNGHYHLVSVLISRYGARLNPLVHHASLRSLLATIIADGRVYYESDMELGRLLVESAGARPDTLTLITLIVSYTAAVVIRWLILFMTHCQLDIDQPFEYEPWPRLSLDDLKRSPYQINDVISIRAAITPDRYNGPRSNQPREPTLIRNSDGIYLPHHIRYAPNRPEHYSKFRVVNLGLSPSDGTSIVMHVTSAGGGIEMDDSGEWISAKSSRINLLHHPIASLPPYKPNPWILYHHHVSRPSVPPKMGTDNTMHDLKSDDSRDTIRQLIAYHYHTRPFECDMILNGVDASPPSVARRRIAILGVTLLLPVLVDMIQRYEHAI
jgi:hypothetical protein